MLKIAIVLGTALVISNAVNAQTQRIAHRSHSGSNQTFKITANENWGLGPEQMKVKQRNAALEKAQSDSIKQRSLNADTARKVALKQIKTTNKKKKKG